MCNPAALAMTTIVAGTAQSYQGNKASGEAQQAYYNYLAAQNEQTAKETFKVAGKQETLIQDEAARTSTNLNRQVKGVEGAQRAAEGASGTSGSVTAEDIAKDTESKANLDRAAIRTSADLQSQSAADAATQQAVALRRQADSYRYAGENAKLVGNINASTSLLSGATAVADQWYRYGQTSKGNYKTVQKPGRGAPTALDTTDSYGNA
jgi:hypothetical protein